MNLLHFPTRNGIAATKGERYTEAEPVAEDVKGEAYREWAGRRMKQIQRCRAMGWKVTGWKLPELKLATDEKPRRPDRTWFDSSWQREYHGRGLAQAPRPVPVDWSVVEVGPGAVFGPSGSEAMLRLKSKHATPNPKHQTWKYLQRGPEPEPTIHPGGDFHHGPRTGRSWLPGFDDRKPDPIPRPGAPLTKRSPRSGTRPKPWKRGRAGPWCGRSSMGSGKTESGRSWPLGLQGAFCRCHTPELVRQW